MASPLALTDLTSALLRTDGSGLVGRTTIGVGLSFDGVTLSSTAVQQILSNSSDLVVTQQSPGIWSLALNLPAAPVYNVSLVAGTGIAITNNSSGTQFSFTITSTAVLLLTSPDGSIDITDYGNGTVALAQNTAGGVVNNLFPGQGITLSATTGNITISTTALLVAESTDGSIIIQSSANGTANFLLNTTGGFVNQLTAANSGIGLSGSTGDVAIANLGLLNATVTGPGITVNVTSGTAAFSSSCLTDIATTGSLLTSTSYPNGTTFLGTTGTPITSLATTSPVTNLGSSSSPNLTLSVSGVTAATYASPSSVTMDKYGRITVATAGSSSTPSYIATSASGATVIGIGAGTNVVFGAPFLISSDWSCSPNTSHCDHFIYSGSSQNFAFSYSATITQPTAGTGNYMYCGFSTVATTPIWSIITQSTIQSSYASVSTTTVVGFTTAQSLYFVCSVLSTSANVGPVFVVIRNFP